MIYRNLYLFLSSSSQGRYYDYRVKDEYISNVRDLVDTLIKMGSKEIKKDINQIKLNKKFENR